jgi:sirohydrochlorin ferrochelatase
VESVASQARQLRPELDVRTGYLDHDEPRLDAAARPGCVVVPLFLASGHHVTVDIPGRAPDSIVTAPIGPDPGLLPVVLRRLVEAGWRSGPVVLAAAGSTSQPALDEVRDVGVRLAAATGAQVRTGFVSAGDPRVDDLLPAAAIASFVLAPGHFHDVLRSYDVPVCSEPLGAAAEVVRVALDRYDAAVNI